MRVKPVYRDNVLVMHADNKKWDSFFERLELISERHSKLSNLSAVLYFRYLHGKGISWEAIEKKYGREALNLVRLETARHLLNFSGKGGIKITGVKKSGR